MKYLLLLFVTLLLGCESISAVNQEGNAQETQCITGHYYGVTRTYGGWPTYFPLFGNDDKPIKCKESFGPGPRERYDPNTKQWKK